MQALIFNTEAGFDTADKQVWFNILKKTVNDRNVDFGIGTTVKSVVTDVETDISSLDVGTVNPDEYPIFGSRPPEKISNDGLEGYINLNTIDGYTCCYSDKKQRSTDNKYWMLKPDVSLMTGVVFDSEET
mgnify:CR=1 FL=1